MNEALYFQRTRRMICPHDFLFYFNPHSPDPWSERPASPSGTRVDFSSSGCPSMMCSARVSLRVFVNDIASHSCTLSRLWTKLVTRMNYILVAIDKYIVHILETSSKNSCTPRVMDKRGAPLQHWKPIIAEGAGVRTRGESETARESAAGRSVGRRQSVGTQSRALRSPQLSVDTWRDQRAESTDPLSASTLPLGTESRIVRLNFNSFILLFVLLIVLLLDLLLVPLPLGQPFVSPPMRGSGVVMWRTGPGNAK